MYPLARIAVAAVAVVAVLGGAIYFLAPGGGVGGPSVATAAPSVRATPTGQITAVPSPAVTSALTAVDATQFAAPFRMTWDVAIAPTVKADVVDIFYNGGGMNVFNVDRVGRDPCRSNELLAQPLRTPQAFMDWLATIPKTTVGSVSRSTVGGHRALERSVSVGTLEGCIDAGNLHSGIASQVNAAPGGYFMAAGEQERWIALNVGGRLIAFVTWWPSDPSTVAEAAARALATITFSP